MNLRFTDVVNNTKNVPQLIEKVNNRNGYVEYGKDNNYPNYLWELYQNSSLMTSIINTMVDYTIGDGIIVNGNDSNIVNRRNQTISDVVRLLVFDYCLYGGFAFQIIRNQFDTVCEINWVDFRHIRINEDETEVYYNNWGDKNNKKKPIKYERYNKDQKQSNSIFYYKGTLTRGVYPIPQYIGCIKSLEISTQIADFHLNQLINNFNPQLLVNFNNGIVSEDVMDEIEAKFEEKYQGTQNAGRIVFSFNNDTEHATTLERIPDDGFDSKYSALKQQIIDDIYMGFRINPVLLGYNTASGFSKIEFSEAFILYNRTTIKPLQQQLQRILEQIFDSVEIKPFTIEWGEDIHEQGNIPQQKEIIN